jgi:hypothetical protein
VSDVVVRNQAADTRGELTERHLDLVPGSYVVLDADGKTIGLAQNLRKLVGLGRAFDCVPDSERLAGPARLAYACDSGRRCQMRSRLHKALLLLDFNRNNNSPVENKDSYRVG